MVADMQNNALLILANSAGYEKIEAALKKLDTAPRQVLIEVTIAEVTLKDDLQYGLEWLVHQRRKKKRPARHGSCRAQPARPGFFLCHHIEYRQHDQFRAEHAGEQQQAQYPVLAAHHGRRQPDGQDPGGRQRAYRRSAVGRCRRSVVSSVQYLDTGVILSVTPHINAGGLVNMDINQEVSNASSTTTSGLNSPTISKRSAKTVVTVQSGETTVLGGLISENSSAGSTGLPFLSSIPILGALFGTQNS